MILPPPPNDCFPQTWFFMDGNTNIGEGIALAVFYIDVNTKNPKFKIALQPTPGSKAEIS